MRLPSWQILILPHGARVLLRSLQSDKFFIFWHKKTHADKAGKKYNTFSNFAVLFLQNSQCLYSDHVPQWSLLN